MIDTEALKRKVLDLAIQGKLTEQLKFENAEYLYNKILLKRNEEIAEGRIKQSNIAISIDAESVPFKLPETWKWVRFGMVFNVVSARRVHKADWRKEGIPFYRAREIAKLARTGSVSNELFISQELFDQFAKSGVPKAGDLMVTGVGTLGETYVVTEKDKFYYKDASVLCLENFANISAAYIKYMMDSQMMKRQIDSNSYGTTVNTLTISQLNEYIFPLPPLEEQLRIVKKIQSLFTQIDGITDLQRQYANNITSLNKKILDLAVRGKLIPQDPNDEPVSVLLKKIAEEKQKLIKEGKIKKQKALQAITEDEIPFDIPKSWEWVRLEDVTKSITDGDHQAPPQTETGISFLVISNVSSGFMDFSNTRHVPEEYFEKLSADRKPAKGDILFTVTGSYGIPMKVETEQEFCFQRHIALIKPMIDANFLVMLLKSPLVKDQCDRVATGTAQKTVGLGSLRNILVPIPPVNEQIRILETLKHTIPLTESLS